jgi:hypothetical protein
MIPALPLLFLVQTVALDHPALSSSRAPEIPQMVIQQGPLSNAYHPRSSSAGLDGGNGGSRSGTPVR